MNLEVSPLELFPFLEESILVLLLIMPNNFRNIFVLCINDDIDKKLLSEFIKGLTVIFFYMHFTFIFLTRCFDSGSYLAKQFKSYRF